MTTTPPRFIKHEPFLRGPVPLSWLATAAKLPGQAFQVGVYVWYLAGLNNTITVKISTGQLSYFGVKRQCVYRALDALQSAKLLWIDQRPGPLSGRHDPPGGTGSRNHQSDRSHVDLSQHARGTCRITGTPVAITFSLSKHNDTRTDTQCCRASGQEASRTAIRHLEGW